MEQSLSVRLQRAREATGLSQWELAQAMGLAVILIEAYESGDPRYSPSVQQTQKFWAFLGMEEGTERGV